MLFRTRGFPSDKFIISPEEASFKNYFLKGVFLLYNELQRTEFNGVLVLTTQQLAEAYGAERQFHITSIITETDLLKESIT